MVLIKNNERFFLYLKLNPVFATNKNILILSIFCNLCRNSLIFEFCFIKSLWLKYQRCTPLGWKDIGIKKLNSFIQWKRIKSRLIILFCLNYNIAWRNIILQATGWLNKPLVSFRYLSFNILNELFIKEHDC